MALTVADYYTVNLRVQAVLFAKLGGQLHSRLVHR